MEIKTLSKEIISRIQSSYTISNLTQCVTELVLNSLDAKSTSIAVRLNANNLKIQVIDNGTGITEENLKKIGGKYMTSKVSNPNDFERKARTHGYRGLTLWSVSNVSKSVNITSRCSISDSVTFSKTFTNGVAGNVIQAKSRQSNGTTITVNGLFDNFPVRQKHTKNEYETEEILNFFKSISIIHPQVSLSLRDNLTGDIIFKSQKHPNVIQAFIELHSEFKAENLTIIKVRKRRISLEALLLKDAIPNSTIQYIFVNKRPVHSKKLKQFMARQLERKTKKKQHTVFLLSIKCCRASYNLIYQESKIEVEFRNNELIERCIAKLVSNFLGKNEKKTLEPVPVKTSKVKSVCGISDLAGAVKGRGYKKWIQNTEQLETIEPFEPERISPEQLEENGENTSLAALNLNAAPINEAKKFVTDNTCIEPANNGIENSFRKNFEKLERNCEGFVAKKNFEETMFSNYTTNEDKGKNLIMYMFLKSTELFWNSQRTRLNEDETVMESNIFYEQTTNMQRMNGTISVSVNVKRKRDSDTQFLNDFTFTMPETKRKRKEILNNINDAKPKEKKRKFSELEPKRREFLEFNLDQTFNSHRNIENNKVDFFQFKFKKNDQVSKIFGPSPKKLINDSFFLSSNNSKKFDFGNISLSPIPKMNFKKIQTDTSPKFSEKTSDNKIRRYHTEPFDNNSKIIRFQKMKENVDKLFKPRNKIVQFPRVNHHDFTQDSLEKNETRITETVVVENQKTVLWKQFLENKKRRVVASPNLNSPDLFPTELNEESTPNKAISTVNTEIATTLTAVHNIESEPDNFQTTNQEWVRKFTLNNDEFFYNTRTGMTTFRKPQIEDEGQVFNFKPRPQFMPKGLSPLLISDEKDSNNLEPLSPTRKLKLNEEILKNYENEIDNVKWEFCIKGSDPKKFFQELYKEKVRAFSEDEIQKCSSTINTANEYKFSKNLFENLEILGQLDKKFIVTIDGKSKVLVLFDQHAVHERIRLEKLTNEYSGSSIICENVTLFMIQNDVKLLKLHENYMKEIGIHFKMIKNGITVNKVPLCLYNKTLGEPKDSTWSLAKSIEHLIREILAEIKETRGVLNGIPKSIHNLICLESCRGAIKFGELLSRDEMKNHMENLSKCSLPFQCAHGRPTLAPILNLAKLPPTEDKPPNLSKLRKLFQK